MNYLKHVLLLCFLQAFGVAAQGKLGFGAKVSVDGFFNPTVKAFKIVEVEPASPAAKAGLKVGLDVIEVDGCQIPGCPASKAKELMDKHSGEILPLLVKDADGTISLVKIEVL